MNVKTTRRKARQPEPSLWPTRDISNQVGYDKTLIIYDRWVKWHGSLRSRDLFLSPMGDGTHIIATQNECHVHRFGVFATSLGVICWLLGHSIPVPTQDQMAHLDKP